MPRLLGSLAREEAAAEAVRRWLREMDVDFGSAVYTRSQWRERGERYGNDAVVTIATEGPLGHLLNNGGGAEARRFYALWERFLKELGLWWDLGYAWSVHLYERP